MAAYPVAGPMDMLGEATVPVGALSGDLRSACLAALGVDREACRRHAAKWSWKASTTQLRASLASLAQR